MCTNQGLIVTIVSRDFDSYFWDYAFTHKKQKYSSVFTVEFILPRNKSDHTFSYSCFFTNNYTWKQCFILFQQSHPGMPCTLHFCGGFRLSYLFRNAISNRTTNSSILFVYSRFLVSLPFHTFVFFIFDNHKYPWIWINIYLYIYLYI